MKELTELDVRRRPWHPAKVLDVTLRDGGFRNRFAWSFDDMVTVATGASLAGSAFVELGYLGGIPELHQMPNAGPTANLRPADVRWVSERAPTARFAAMVHPTGTDQILPFSDYRAAGLELVRLVYHESWDSRFFNIAEQAAAAGLQTSANFALASRYSTDELMTLSKRARAAGIGMVYIADTCGALLPDEVSSLTRALTELGPVGFHAHDYLSLALANTLAATAAGATWIDASIGGIGRGAGNLRLELWLAIETACSGTGAKLSTLVSALDLVEARIGVPPAPDLCSIVSGALNLTPPQEGQLRVEVGKRSVAEVAAVLMDHHKLANTVAGAFSEAVGRS